MTDSILTLEWDSLFFDRCVGKLLPLAENELENSLQDANCQGYRLVYIYSECEVRQSKIGQFTLLDVGGQIEYSKTVTIRSNCDKPNLCINLCTEERPSRDIVELAYISGHLSRFRIDPFLPVGSFERLYKAWLDKTLDRASMAEIYSYCVEGRAVGMITSEWNEDTCTIGLLAVHPSSQGLGIGTQLIMYVERLCVEKGIGFLKVKTQASNASAQALYLKNMFSEEHRTFLYHAHLLPSYK